jgi:hypothetical protein
MAFLSTSSAVIEAILTERGRQVLASDPTKFKITKWAAVDDEIDYGLTSAEIQALEIYEPITREHSLQYRLLTLSKGSKYVGSLQFSADQLTIAGTGNAQATVSTLSLPVEQNGYTVFVDTLDVTIEAVDAITTTSSQVVEQIGSSNTQSLVCKSTFTVKGKNVAGTYFIRVIGNDSGASKKLQVDVTFVDYSLLNQTV